MKKPLAIVLAVSLAGISYNSFASSGSKGTTSANFLKIGVGGRAVAMGEAYGAVTSDANSIYWNPAGLARINKGSVSLMHATYIDDANFNHVAFGYRVGERGVLGVGGEILSAGSVKGRDINGNETGSFEPKDSAFSVGYGNEVKGYLWGVTAKYIKSTLVASASTFAFDGGIMTPLFFQEKWRMSFSASNLGGKLKYEEESEKLPTAFRFGNAFQLMPRWILSADLVVPNDNSLYPTFGTEYQFSVGEQWALAARAGYNSRNASDIDGFSGPTFGFGIGLRQFALDYGFVPFGDVGDSHRVSIGWNF